MRYVLLVLLAVCAIPAATAQAPVPGTCALGTATGRLNASDVEATLYTGGNLFFGGAGEAQYVVPRTTGLSPLYAAGIWIGGRVGSEVRFAGNRYANFQFWPGPLAANGSPVNPADCSAYDRIWVVSTADVAAYESGDTPTVDLATWPIGLGAGAVDAQGNPIPQGTDLTRVINLTAGERPVVYGSQTAFWVMNDAGAPKWSNPISNAMGLEVRVHAFVVAPAEAALAQATFYRYELIYRGTDTMTDVRFSVFTDPDLGNAADDYVHTDVARGMGVAYNGDSLDEGVNGYGPQPPALGIDLLNGLGASSTFMNGVVNGDPTADPQTTAQYYNYQQGLWADGQPVREGGQGRNTTGAVTTVFYPGDPVTAQFWSEENAGPEGPTPIGDRRLIVSTPPFTMAPGGTRTIEVAVLYGHGQDRLASITALRAASDRVQGLRDSGQLYGAVPTPPPPPLPAVAPAPVAPADGAVLGVATAVTLRWTPVSGATDYLVDTATDADFTAGLQHALATADSVAVSVPINTQATLYWRVRALNTAGAGPVSAARRFTVTGIFVPMPTDVQEWNAAGPIVTAADGSATNPSLLGSLNSTATRPPGYLVGAAGAPANEPAAVLAQLDVDGVLTANVPNDYELRWVDAAQGSAVFSRATGEFMNCYETGSVQPSTGGAPGGPVTNIVEVPVPVVGGLPFQPFQLWEVRPDGTEQQMVALVLDDNSDRCYGLTTAADARGGAPFSESQYERIYGTRVPYDEAALRADPAAVFAQTQLQDAAHQAFGRLQVVLYSVGPASPPQAGTRIRVMTSNPSVASEAPAPGIAALTIEQARPNPVRERATLRLTVPTDGPVRAALYDVLGRQVAVLLSGTVATGLHTVTLDGASLAPGVYVVVVEQAGAHASRVVTVAR